MKFSACCLALLLVSLAASAEPLLKDPYVGAMGSFLSADKDVGSDTGFGGGFYGGASVARYINLEFSALTNSLGGKDHVVVTGLDAMFKRSDGQVQGFLLAGAGYDFDFFRKSEGGDHNSPYVDVGAGLLARVSQHFGLRAEGRYYALFNTSDNNDDNFLGDWRINLGVQYAFGTIIPPTKTIAAAQVIAAAPVAGPMDSDGDGVPDAIDECPGTPPGVTVNAKGCPVDGDEDGDGVPDSLDKCPGTLKGFKVDAVGCIVEQTVILRAVNFDFGSDKLTAEAKTTLDQLSSSLKTQPGLELQIAGHTDSLGPAGFNLTLSQKRAAAVKSYLVAHSVDGKRLKSEGYGEFNPIATNETEEGRAQNRRVEFKVLDKSVPTPTSITLPVPADAPNPPAAAPTPAAAPGGAAAVEAPAATPAVAETTPTAAPSAGATN